MYIFSYGSLINSASRKLTGQTGQAIPAIVDGLIPDALILKGT